MGRLAPAAIAIALLALACGEAPPDASSYADAGQRDGGFLDFGLHQDARPSLDAVAPDRPEADAAAPETGGSELGDADAPDLWLGDAEPEDLSAPDAGPQDLGADAGTDAGGHATDEDRDTISDRDEGLGGVDTDGDGVSDWRDLDSDGDGLLDLEESGDADLGSPPIDTDADRAPDFRDLDSDGDGLPDPVETSTDTDGDGRPDFRDLDSDGDGIPDRVETSIDTDGDGGPDFRDLDSDGDGIPDASERAGDPDGDGVPSFRDLDSDGDGIPDASEGFGDPDRDGGPSFLDLDSDGDGIGDRFEGELDRDGDGVPGFLDLDSDGDTIPDANEGGHGDPSAPPIDSDFDGVPDFLDLDSDGDTIPDASEGPFDKDWDGLPDRLDIDADNDAILDNVEAGDTSTSTPPVDTDGDSTPDYLDLDSDGDAIFDLSEGSADADGDGLPNYIDLDSDGDAWADAIEAGDADPQTPPIDTDGDRRPDYLDLDSDNEGLRDADEPGCPAGPDRRFADTDQDGFLDPVELAFGSSPCDASSGIDAFYFVQAVGAPPSTAPLEFAGTDIDRLDVALHMDTTASMGGERNNLVSTIRNVVVQGVRASVADPAFSVSTFEDFPVDPFGSSTWGPDRPFRLLQRVSTNADDVTAGVAQIRLGVGHDLPEAGLESLYQIATGAGARWSGGATPPFDPSRGLRPGIADGELGGVGFRAESLPVIVHITDAISHVQRDYHEVDPSISAVATATVFDALRALSARVVTIASSNLPRPVDLALFDELCDGRYPRGFATIARPTGTDRDWFVLQGAQAGNRITIEARAERAGSTLDTLVELYDAQTILRYNDDPASGSTRDSFIDGTLSGSGPFMLSVRSSPDNSGTATETTGFYFLEVQLNGVPYVPSTIGCRTDDGDGPSSATTLAPLAQASLPADPAACAASCRALLATVYDAAALPYAISERTRAVVPACAWDAFGAGRPALCAPNQCCTDIDGGGEEPNDEGLCPLSFRIAEDGSGLGQAIVTGVEALASVAGFTITTRVRGSPADVAAYGVDSACFIRSVIPASAQNVQACAPTPRPADLQPPRPQLDAFLDVAPGTRLVFEITAVNEHPTTGQPCAVAARQSIAYRAFIDVLADGVTVLDTRDVVIVVPGAGGGGGSH